MLGIVCVRRAFRSLFAGIIRKITVVDGADRRVRHLRENGGERGAIARFKRGSAPTKQEERLLGGRHRQVQDVGIEQGIVSAN